MPTSHRQHPWGCQCLQVYEGPGKGCLGVPSCSAGTPFCSWGICLQPWDGDNQDTFWGCSFSFVCWVLPRLEQSWFHQWELEALFFPELPVQGLGLLNCCCQGVAQHP